MAPLGKHPCTALAQVCEQVAGNATAQPAGMLSQQVATMSATTISSAVEHCAFVLWMSKAVSRPTYAPRFRLLLPGILVEYVCSLFNGRMLNSFQDVDDGLESLECAVTKHYPEQRP